MKPHRLSRPRRASCAVVVSRKQYNAFVRTVCQDLQHHSIYHSEQRAAVRARTLFFRGLRESREHGRDLALQAMCDAPFVLGYGRERIQEYMDGRLGLSDELQNPWPMICALVTDAIEKRNERLANQKMELRRVELDVGMKTVLCCQVCDAILDPSAEQSGQCHVCIVRQSSETSHDTD